MQRAAVFAFGLTLALYSGTALAVSTLQDADRAANAVVSYLNGLNVICPFAVRDASPLSRCVELTPGVQGSRLRLSAAVNLYGAWSAGESPGSLSNWILTPGGFLSLTLAPAPTHPANSLVVISVPVARPSAAGAVAASLATLKSATSPVPVAAPPPASRPESASPGSSAPVFRRTLRLGSPRMNGEDVRTLQNRLIDMSKKARGTGGDGWYGPVTEATVMDFQNANGLRPTGTVDQRTWTALFSGSARRFGAKLAEAMVRGRR